MKTSVKTAAKGSKSRIPLRSNSLTTFDIGTTRPMYCLPLLAGETLHFTQRQMSELSPLVVKTFGELHFKHSCVFVPHRVVWRQYEDYRRSSQDSSINVTPKTFTAFNFFGWFLKWNFNTADGIFVFTDSVVENPFMSAPRAISDSFPTADIIVLGSLSGGTPRKFGFNLTKRGREIVNTLFSLGYRFPLDFCGNVTDSNLLEVIPVVQQKFMQSSYDALPLLSYARALYDYIYPSRYIDKLGVGRLWDNDTESYGVDDSDWFADIFSLVFTQYDNHFFTSLFVQPNNVIAGTPAASSIVANNDIMQTGQQLSNNLGFNVNSQRNTIYQGSQTYTGTLSSFGLRWLQSASDYILRNNIGGRRFRDWAESHFGFVTKDMNSDISEWISSWQESIQFNGVRSTAETNGARLGDQAGHGESFGMKKINFTAHEDGFFFIISQLIPSVVYYQGQAPWTHPLTSPLQLYTPEFEAQGFEAIPLRDIFLGSNGNLDNPFDGVFGYAPRYSNRYKRPYDSMSGDFVFGSRNTNMQAFHTFRDLQPYFDSNEASSSLAFLQVENQYGRIFQLDPTDSDRSSLYDKVFTLFAFDAEKETHLRSLSDSLPLFDKSGKDANINYLGD